MTTVSLRVRGLAALAVLVLFPVFVVLLIALIVGAAGWATVKINGSVGNHVVVLVIPLILALGAAIRDVVKARKPRPLPGPELTRPEHPALWAELDWLASAMDQPEPDRVVVLPTVNAFVTTAAGGREVMIGYPLLAGLSRAQLRSVLAHEMGHLAHGHTRTSGLAYRASSVLQQTVAGLDPSLVRSLVVGYYRFYLLISMSVLRDHERQADDWSARLAGGPDAASVFPALARLDAVWDMLFDHYLPLATRVAARPPLALAIYELSEGHKSELDRFVAEQIAEEPSRWSTHPADAERMQRLESASPPSPSTHTPEPAWHLLGRQTSGPLDPQVAGNALLGIEAELVGPDTTEASWEQIVQDAELADVRDHLGFVLDQFAVQAPDRPADLWNLLEVLGTGTRGAGGALLRPLMRGDLPPEHRQAALESAITSAARAAIYVTLIDAGRGRTALRWNGPAELEYRLPSGEVVAWPPELEPESPLDGGQVARILGRLMGDGVNVSAPLVCDPADLVTPAGTLAGGLVGTGSVAGGTVPAWTGSAGSTSRAGTGRPRARSRALRSIASGGIAAVQVRPRRPGLGRKDLHDVLIMDDGLLVARIAGQRFGLLAAVQANYLPGPLVRKGVERIQLLVDGVEGAPQSWSADPTREAFWIPYPTVRQAVLRKGRGNLVLKRLTLDLADRSTLIIKWTAYSAEVGDVDSVLHATARGRL